MSRTLEEYIIEKQHTGWEPYVAGYAFVIEYGGDKETKKLNETFLNLFKNFVLGKISEEDFRAQLSQIYYNSSVSWYENLWMCFNFVKILEATAKYFADKTEEELKISFRNYIRNNYQRFKAKLKEMKRYGAPDLEKVEIDFLVEYLHDEIEKDNGLKRVLGRLSRIPEYIENLPEARSNYIRKDFASPNIITSKDILRKIKEIFVHKTADSSLHTKTYNNIKAIAEESKITCEEFRDCVCQYIKETYMRVFEQLKAYKKFYIPIRKPESHLEDICILAIVFYKNKSGSLVEKLKCSDLPNF